MIGASETIASEMTPEGLALELNTRQLLDFIPDIMPAGDVAVCKLMWILGQTREFGRVRELFSCPVAWDILTRS